MTPKTHKEILDILNTETFAARPKLLKYMEGVQVEEETKEKQRTPAQNKSGHKYWDDVASELEAQGITRKTIVEDLEEAGVPLTSDFIKHVVWFHFMVGMYGKTHTPELTTKEWTEVEKVFTLHLREHYGLQTDYPSVENNLLMEMDNEKYQ